MLEWGSSRRMERPAIVVTRRLHRHRPSVRELRLYSRHSNCLIEPAYPCLAETRLRSHSTVPHMHCLHSSEIGFILSINVTQRNTTLPKVENKPPESYADNVLKWSTFASKGIYELVIESYSSHFTAYPNALRFQYLFCNHEASHIYRPHPDCICCPRGWRLRKLR